MTSDRAVPSPGLRLPPPPPPPPPSSSSSLLLWSYAPLQTVTNFLWCNMKAIKKMIEVHCTFRNMKWIDAI